MRNPKKCIGHQADENLRNEEEGYLIHKVRMDREKLVGGIFYAVLSMRAGRSRNVTIERHLAYRDQGIPSVIPSNAKLAVEIKILKEA